MVKYGLYESPCIGYCLLHHRSSICQWRLLSCQRIVILDYHLPECLFAILTPLNLPSSCVESMKSSRVNINGAYDTHRQSNMI